MIDLLVISHACFMAINRNVYHLFMQDGWRVEMVVPVALNFPSGREIAEPKREADPVIHYLDLNGNNPRTYLFESLEKILTEKKPKIVLLDNDPVSRLAFVVGKWCGRNNAKLFCISCDNLPLDIISTIKRKGLKALPAAVVKRLLLSKTRKMVDGVFTISNDGQQIFNKEGYRQVAKIPLGFDPAYFYPDKDARERLRVKLGLKKIVIAYFGRLTKEKGVHILIKALEGLKEIEWILMMDNFDKYASGYNTEIHQLIQEAGFTGRLIFINPSHYEIAGYMNAADIVVVPSISAAHWKEQYGRVAAEAMACGKIVIASDSGALPELLNNFGWIFPEGNIEALREILKMLLEDKIKDYENSPGISSYAKDYLSINTQQRIMESVFKNTNPKI